MAEAAAQPRDAALWLSPEQQEEWVATKKQVKAGPAVGPRGRVSAARGAAARAAAAVAGQAGRRLLWLEDASQTRGANTSSAQVPALMFFSFLAFNGVAWLALRLINRGGRIRAPSNLVLLKAG